MRKRRRSLIAGVAVLSALALAVSRLHRWTGRGPAVVARIAEIQGAAHVSPLVGRKVRYAVGVVTAVLENGFFLQDPEGDGLPATSEAVFVFTPDGPGVSVGDQASVSGRVVEYYPGGRDSGNLSTTQIGWAEVRILSGGHPLPAAITLVHSAPARGERAVPRDVIEDDAGGGPVDASGVRFDPENDALDFFESLEGMRVRVRDADVVGPLNGFGELVVVARGEGDGKTRTPRGGILLSPDNANPERLTFDDMITPHPPAVNVGDRLEEGVGVMDYRFGSYRILNTEPLKLRRARIDPEMTGLRGTSGKLTVASYNVRNLYSGERARTRAIARQIVLNLGSPDILALQEMQDNSGKRNDDVVAADETFQALIEAISEAGGPRYEFRQIDPRDDQDGGNPGGNIRVGYLLRPSRVEFVDRFDAPVFRAAPELEGRPFSEAGRLRSAAFAGSRKPLLGVFRFEGQILVLINVHQSSRSGSSPSFGRIQPPADPTRSVRAAQARALRAHVSRLLEADPGARLAVLGDFNDNEFAESLVILAGTDAGPLVNLTRRLPPAQRYTYIYRGNSQALDHILVTKELAERAEYEVVHVNADFTASVSDHDPVVARFTLK